MKHFPDREQILHKARELYYAIECKEGRIKAIRIVSKTYHVDRETVRKWKKKGFELTR